MRLQSSFLFKLWQPFCMIFLSTTFLCVCFIIILLFTQYTMNILLWFEGMENGIYLFLFLWLNFCTSSNCRDPLPDPLRSVLEEGINLYDLHTKRHGRLVKSLNNWFHIHNSNYSMIVFYQYTSRQCEWITKTNLGCEKSCFPLRCPSSVPSFICSIRGFRLVAPILLLVTALTLMDIFTSVSYLLP